MATTAMKSYIPTPTDPEKLANLLSQFAQSVDAAEKDVRVSVSYHFRTGAPTFAPLSRPHSRLSCRLRDPWH